MCLALTANSPTAALKVISLRQAVCASSVKPQLKTCTEDWLLHKKVTHFPLRVGPQTWMATMIATNSKEFMCRFCDKSSAGNLLWKKLPLNQPPHRVRQASVENSPSGSDQGYSGIIETTLYVTRNLFHHFKSAFVSQGIWMKPLLGVLRSKASYLIVKILPGRTQAATNFNLPRMFSKSYLEHLNFPTICPITVTGTR